MVSFSTMVHLAFSETYKYLRKKMRKDRSKTHFHKACLAKLLGGKAGLSYLCAVKKQCNYDRLRVHFKTGQKVPLF